MTRFSLPAPGWLVAYLVAAVTAFALVVYFSWRAAAGADMAPRPPVGPRVLPVICTAAPASSCLLAESVPFTAVRPSS